MILLFPVVFADATAASASVFASWVIYSVGILLFNVSNADIVSWYFCVAVVVLAFKSFITVVSAAVFSFSKLLFAASASVAMISVCLWAFSITAQTGVYKSFGKSTLGFG